MDDSNKLQGTNAGSCFRTILKQKFQHFKNKVDVN